MVRRLFLSLLTGLVASGQTPSTPPHLAGAPKVDLKGTIERVQIQRGQGMPSLELRTEHGTRRVILGSMRYLLEQNFNPKAGSEAVVRGFDLETVVIAQSVEIPKEKVRIQLRDENGRPMWGMGRMGRGWGKQ